MRSMEDQGWISIGPYHFDVVDVRRTVAEALHLLDDHVEHEPSVADVVGRTRRRLIEVIGDLDAWHAPIDAVSGVLPDVWAALTGVRADLAAAGLLPERSEGAVVGLHLGDGGVPKRSVRSVEVDHGGVVGDRQGTRRHHGAPWQALCLWSEEVIAAFASGGHPIGPGLAGENVTVAGIRWGSVRPGVRLTVGTVVCEVAAYAVPCRQLSGWFSDRDFGRIHHRHGPVSRMYATVVEPGSIRLGDPVVVEPSPSTGTLGV